MNIETLIFSFVEQHKSFVIHVAFDSGLIDWFQKSAQYALKSNLNCEQDETYFLKEFLSKQEALAFFNKHFENAIQVTDRIAVDPSEICYAFLVGPNDEGRAVYISENT